jgi:Tol biopolymer transport system component
LSPSGTAVFSKWSPDGRQLLYLLNGSIHVVELSSGKSRAVLAPFDHQGERVSVAAMAWSADGRDILFKAAHSGGGQSFWSVPATGGTPRLLVRFDDSTRPSRRQEFATDGKRFYFTVDNRQSDIWVMSVQEGK